MTRKFLDKYFSPAKTAKFRREIHNFCQKETETVFEAWERFKEIVRKWQHSGIEFWMQLHDFWDGHLDAMAKEIRKVTLVLIQSEPHATCDICGRGHPIHECQASIEEVNDVGNYNFNAMRKRHPSFSWSSLGGTANPIQAGLEDLIKAFIIKTDERLDAHGVAIKELGTSFRKLEKQVEQLATILFERASGNLPTDTERNPKETVNVVTLRSGQVLKDPTPIQNDVKLEKDSGEQLKNDVDKNKKGQMKAEKNKKGETLRREEPEENQHMPALPFPQKLYREKLDKQFERFLDMLKQFMKLKEEIGEIRSAPISLLLEDQTTLIPEGIVEDVFVRVDKFVFPVDFIVLKMEENKEVPLILGKPFLATGRAILDIHERKLMLRVSEETLTFKMDVEKGCKKEN
ncbi:uncharacterized protein [Nicotiana tomentosiformis]|uniref:uncharacterized protein n=1 Tax=Nicotiana tomentosiformis TaxID=4098 RepID=UPI00388CC887